jgi:hypothetical protein
MSRKSQQFLKSLCRHVENISTVFKKFVSTCGEFSISIGLDMVLIETLDLNIVKKVVSTCQENIKIV